MELGSDLRIAKRRSDMTTSGRKFSIRTKIALGSRRQARSRLNATYDHLWHIQRLIGDDRQRRQHDLEERCRDKEWVKPGPTGHGEAHADAHEK